MRRFAFLTGLFLTTLATLTLELLDTRLLSVLTWYHLSFFAVSTAMFGMSAGAVRVYLGGARFSGDRAPRALVRATTALALVIPFSHAANLYIRIDTGLSLPGAFALLGTTIALALPFYLSGVAVALALTRVPGSSGLVYAAVAAAAALCFRVYDGRARRSIGVALVLLLVVATVANHVSRRGLRVIYAKGNDIYRSAIDREFWTIHGQLITRPPALGMPWYWGPGKGAWDYTVESVAKVIDGSAATVLTPGMGTPIRSPGCSTT